MLSFPNVMYFFTNELACLRRWGLSFPCVPVRAFSRCLAWHLSSCVIENRRGCESGQTGASPQISA
jgi:hypothetical protein